MATKAELKKYRSSLIDTLRFLNESYDKLLITLSGGALGISIAFLKDVVKLENVVCQNLLRTKGTLPFISHLIPW